MRSWYPVNVHFHNIEETQISFQTTVCLKIFFFHCKRFLIIKERNSEFFSFDFSSEFAQSIFLMNRIFFCEMYCNVSHCCVSHHFRALEIVIIWDFCLKHLLSNTSFVVQFLKFDEKKFAFISKYLDLFGKFHSFVCFTISDFLGVINFIFVSFEKHSFVNSSEQNGMTSFCFF